MAQSTGATPSKNSTPAPSEPSSAALPVRDTNTSSYPGASTYRTPAATTSKPKPTGSTR